MGFKFKDILAPIATATLGPLAGAAVGYLTRDKNGNQVQMPSSSSGVARTPGQIEMDNYYRPILKDWMAKPPKIKSNPYQQTNVTVGGNKLQYNPSSSGINSSNGILNQYGVENTAQLMPNNNGIRVTPQNNPNPTPTSATPQSGDTSSPGDIFANGDFGFQGGYNYQPGSVNLPDIPTSELVSGKFGDYQAVNPDKNFSDYNNGLESDIEKRLRSDMNRTVYDGYDMNYLNNLKDKGMDILNENYNQSMNDAQAYANKHGLSGSGFEQRDLFGTQKDSITRNYLDRSKELNRDIALSAAEAKREDAFRNAQLQDSARNLGYSLSGRQSQDQMNRLARDLNTKQQNEAYRQWWANKNTNDVGIDNASRNRDYSNAANLGKWLINREDLQNKNNVDLNNWLQQQNINYPLSIGKDIQGYINGQNALSNQMASNYWNGVNQQNANDARNYNDISAITSGLTSIFNQGNQSPVAANNGGGDTNWWDYITQSPDLINQYNPFNYF